MVRHKHGPEYKIQTDFIAFLKDRGWHVERMVGNAFQMGIPDIYAAHPKYGQRWIDLKNPGRYELTKAQRKKWPIWERFGVGIWIIVAADEEEYDKLFRPPNWRRYWKAKYDEEIEELKEAMENLFDKGESELHET